MWRSKGGDQHPGDQYQKDPIEKPLPKRALAPEENDRQFYHKCYSAARLCDV